MSRFARTSIRSRLALALVLLLAPLVVVGYGTLKLKKSVLVVEQTVKEPILLLRYSINKAVFYGERYILEGNTSDGETYFALEADIDETYDQLIAKDLREKNGRPWLIESRDLWREALNAAHALAAETQPDLPAGNARLLRRWKEQMSGAAEALLQESLSSLDEAQRRAEESRDEAEALVFRVRLLLGLSLLVTLAAALILRSAILRPLGELRHGVGTVGDGDLSHRVSSAVPREFGELADAFNRMAERLEQLTIRDELTGLFNRREMNRRLDEEIARSRRYDHALSFLMMDIDHFKSVNDRYGHQAGDQVLRQIAQRIIGAVRPTDWVARYGGEELAAVLPETEAGNAIAVAERIRESVAREPFILDNGATLQLTVSVGAGSLGGDATTAFALIEAADRAVYQAKREGRNCVRISA